jgi:ADP-ribose pyrophosphatase YjhB (NUDIX family)
VERIIIRVNGVLIEDGKMLLVEQDVTKTRHWAHPGGALEFGETIEQCLIREMKEETGLDVSVDGLLYVIDRIQHNSHVVVISLLVSKKGGKLGTGDGPEFATGKIKSVKMVPLGQLQNCGFSPTYCNLVKSGFPDRGSYKGNIYD